MPDEAAAQILPSAEKVKDLAGQHVLHHGVHGEIPPPGGLFLPEKGIDGYREILMSPAGGALRAGHGDIELAVPQPHDAEARAHGQPLAQAVEDLLQRLHRNAVHLDVDILGLPAEKTVADISAHEKRAPARLMYCGGNGFRHPDIAVFHALASRVRKSSGLYHGQARGDNRYAPSMPGMSPSGTEGANVSSPSACRETPPRCWQA